MRSSWPTPAKPARPPARRKTRRHPIRVPHRRESRTESSPNHPAIPRFDAADLPLVETEVAELAADAFRVEGTDDQGQTDSHIKHLVHLGLIDLAELLQPAEDRRDG